MRLLLDTHALIWAIAEPARLPDGLRATVADPTTDVLVSTVSAWEVALKTSLGRLEFQPVDDELLNRYRFRHHSIDLRHASAVARLPRHHGDPFDRMLIAQAIVDDLVLASADRAFAAYDVDVRWA